MSDQFDNQPLETFFHQYLDQYGEEPGKGFWEELEGKIPPPPKKKRRFLFWWFAWGVALLAAFIIYLNYNFGRIDELEQWVEVQQGQIDKFTSGKEIETEIPNPIPKLRDKHQAPTVPKEPTTPTAPTVTTVPIALTATTEQTTIQPDNTIPDTLSTEAKTIQNENNTPSKKDLPDESESILAIPLLLSKEIFAEYNRPYDLPGYSFHLPEKFTNFFDLGIFYENWIRTTIRNLENADIFATTDYQGNTWGLRLGINFSRNWQLQTGLGWARVQADNSGFATLVYSEDGAWEGPGNTSFNSYSFRFATPFGFTSYESEIGFPLENPDTRPEPGNPFTLEISQQDRLDYLYFPLLLQFQSSPKKWQWSAGLGLDFYRLLNREVNSTVTPRPFLERDLVIIEEVNVSPDKRLEGLRNMHLGVQGTAGIHYQLNNRWQVHLQGAYHWGIRPVSNETQHLTYFGLRLGSSYRF